MTIPPFKNSVYPEFVADQVLTSDNLNNLFGYLDEQERMTRTQLVGVGIACGFNIITATVAGNSAITITKGVGITSEGYLVAAREKNYTKRSINPFNSVQCEYYSKFVDTAEGANTPKLNLWELKEADDSDTTEVTGLTEAFLNEGNKIVLLFVELLEENNKNCDPNSCDDKGTKVNVNIRVLLAARDQVNTQLSNSSNIVVTGKALLLPEMRSLPKYNASNPALNTAADILNAYWIILHPAFLGDVKRSLISAYTELNRVLQKDFNNSDFNGSEFEVINRIYESMISSPISQSRLLHLQYYYDFFSDILLAYQELRTKTFELVCDCVPDNELFPRHLLLGEAVGFDEASSLYRTRFVSSGALCCCAEDTETIKFLFQRLVLMFGHFSIPGVTESDFTRQSLPLVITPSILGTAPLSERAIPYYYEPNAGTKKLYRYWNHHRSLQGKQRDVLSYWSSEYNPNTDPDTKDAVVNPLMYDLEPYNFFRVEGIIGKPLSTALPLVTGQVKDYALPIKTVALATGSPRLGYDNDECCSFSDIELQYHLLKTTLLCCIRNNVRFWGSLEKKDDSSGSAVLLPPMVLVNAVAAGLLSGGAVFSFLGTSAGVDTGIATPVSDSHGPVIGAGNIEATITPVFHARPTAAPASGRNAAAASSTVAPPLMSKGSVIRTVFGSQVSQSSIAYQYQQYQLGGGVNIGSLPAPASTSPAENISFYILVLIDELEALADALEAESVKDFNEGNFISHADKLKEVYTKLSQLVSGYHSKGFLVAKLKLNAPSQTAEIDRIAAAMPIMSDTDVGSIFFIFLNSPNIAGFVSQIETARGNYANQKAIINRVRNGLVGDLMMERIMEDPPASSDSEYNSMLEQLKKGICSCEIDNLKYLIQKYREQFNQLQDMENFSVYVKHHPGIQHKAGVSNGGTFVVVYKGANDDTLPGILAGTVIADFYLPYTCCSDCTPVEVTVQQASPAVNMPPVAKPGENVTIQQPASSVTLDGRASSDPDGTVATYLWEQIEGTAANISDAAIANPVVSGLSIGTYKFKLTVTDNDNATNAGIITITVVERTNTRPAAVASSDKINITLPENTVTLSGANSTAPDGSIASYAWSIEPVTTDAVIQNAGSVSTIVTFSQPGLFAFTLTVTDNNGDTDTDKIFILVNRRNERINTPPVARAAVSRNTVTLENGVAKVRLNGAESFDPDGAGIAAYEWILPGGTQGAAIAEPTKDITDVDFTQPGIYLFTLTVTDNDHASSNAFAIVAVNERRVVQNEISCGEFSSIGSDFDKIAVNEEEPFKSFKVNYAMYPDVETFYNKARLENTAQMDFFIAQKVNSLIIKWINNLRPQIANFDLRLAALTMLNVHAKLAYYVSCLQSDDIDNTTMSMVRTLDALIATVNNISVQVPNSTPDQKDLIKVLLTVTNKAKTTIERRSDNKPVYLQKLSDIIGKISSMQL